MRKVHTLIIGAGPGGLSAATCLAKAGREVLVVEKNPVVGPKLCGGYLPLNHETQLMDIPAQVIEKTYPEIVVRQPGRSVRVGSEPKITFDRKDLGQAMLERACAAGAQVETGRCLTGFRHHEARVDDEVIGFSCLIGADGSFSKVRQALGLGVGSYYIAVQSNLPESLPDIEFIFDVDRYRCWPAWVIPHRDHTIVGVGGDPRVFPAGQVKRELRELVRSRGYDPARLPMRGATLALDYAGHVFGNVFLVGDAAGLISDWDGGGIYAAWASGFEVGQYILQGSHPFPLTRSVLASKRVQRWVVRALSRGRLSARILFGAMLFALRFGRMSRRLSKVLHPLHRFPP